MDEVSFDVSRADAKILSRLGRRAADLDTQANGNNARPVLDWHMDLTAAHANGCPLDLAKLEAADDFNFAHDVFGIMRHINRETGKIENHFLPRCHA